MSHLATEAFSHARRVCSLYKRCARCIRDHYALPQQYLFYEAWLRNQFDLKKNVTDYREADKLLQEGEKLLFENMHPTPSKFFESPGGVGFGRKVRFPDWVLDTWHPLEKAQYPKYFATREIRKREYLEKWEKKYGKPAEA